MLRKESLSASPNLFQADLGTLFQLILTFSNARRIWEIALGAKDSYIVVAFVQQWYYWTDYRSGNENEAQMKF